ncbi:MAG: NAD-dependent protein deacylase [Planctomycetes bacterium]|nr:NAD-dependent protein deacylase [Planctomycetota bacterium]
MSLSDIRDALLVAKHVIAFTGAGVSVASGIPDFRSPDGIWARYPPEQFATIEAFERDPEGWWTFHWALSAAFAGAAPNTAHEALGALDALGLLKAVITQNIDGLHQRAGHSQVIELHGGNSAMQCLRCDADVDRPVPLGGEVPRCETCRAVLKPDVVLFGEQLDHRKLHQAQLQAAQADMCLVVGTSAVVFPAASIPILTHESDGAVCVFNRESTNLTDGGFARWFVEGPAEETLPRLIELVRAELEG